MKSGGTYRDVTPSEVRQIEETINGSFGTGVTTALLNSGRLVCLEKKYPAIFWVSEVLYQTLTHLKTRQKGGEGPFVHSVGIMVGFFRKGQFLIGIEQIRKLGPLTKQWVEVTEQGEQLFLYGKHLQKRSITEISGALPKGARVVVRNRMKEALGIGVLVESGTQLETVPAKREVVKNLTDLGTRYLRKGA